MSFSQLRIGSDLLQSYKKNHIGEPTTLQKRLIQAIREGGDVLVYDPSGTESEIGYLTSLLDYLAKQERKQGTRAVIISPDPDRLAHLNRWILMISEHLGVTTAVVDPASEKSQIRNKIAAGPSIILATPTELAKWMEENRMILRDASWYILDQVSNVEDWRAVDVISQRIIGNQQRIAALTVEEEEATEPLNKLLREPIVVHPPTPSRQKETRKSEPEPVTTPVSEKTDSLPDPEQITLSGQLTQYYIQTPPRMKISTLLARLEEDTRRTIIFTSSQRTADRLYRILRKNNHRAVSLGPSLEEETRNERLNRFATGDVPFLIAGDTTAADCALADIEQVINYDVPEEVNEYKLRAELLADESNGMVLSLVSKQDRGDIREIIGQLGYAPEELPLPEKVEEESKQQEEQGKGRSSSKNRSTDSAEKESPAAGRSKQHKPSADKSRDRSSRSRSGSRTNGSSKDRSKGDSRKRSGKKPRPQRGPTVDPDAPIRLPKPSFDKLSGGRTGKSAESSGGLVDWVKKLFS